MTDVDVDGLRVVVTAGGAGIGWATAHRFAQHGARVSVCDIDPDAVDGLLATGIHALVSDVGDTESVDTFMSAALDSLGGIDVLVNNAGVAGPAGRADTVDPDEVTASLDVNVTSMFRTVRHAVPAMLEQGGGSIVNVASTAGQLGFPNRSPYAVAKWAVVGLTKTLAMELGPFGIRCNAVAPGSIAGPRMDHVIELEAAASGRDPAEVRLGFERQVSMGTFVQADDIAQTICFLASPMAARISGQVLAVDGNTETLRT